MLSHLIAMVAIDTFVYIIYNQLNELDLIQDEFEIEVRRQHYGWRAFDALRGRPHNSKSRTKFLASGKMARHLSNR